MDKLTERQAGRQAASQPASQPHTKRQLKIEKLSFVDFCVFCIFLKMLGEVTQDKPNSIVAFLGFMG